MLESSRNFLKDFVCMKLVIVESPAKSKTIQKYLGADYKVLASFGHIRDLPSKNGSVLPDEDFAMVYEVQAESKKHVDAIAAALKNVSAVYLATDPDREGEAISWHVLEALRERKALSKNPEIHRVTFTEITKRAVQYAIAHPRAIDMDLVNAQQARRALDYLVGFNLSPVLWRKLPGSRSAGRVQSVALRLVCERELEIERFRSQEYWSIILGLTTPKKETFSAKLTHINGEKLEQFSITNTKQAEEIVSALRQGEYHVSALESKQLRRNPPAPFTTSTLQQEASRKLGFSTKKTMQIAQRLYEGVEIGGETVGLITYMRTDGVTVSAEAIAETRQMIGKKFGDNYVPQAPRIFTAKAKNAQEAHEAIRPTDVRRSPDYVESALDRDQMRLYELIWKRMVASQMESAVLDQLAATILKHDQTAKARAVGSAIHFDGFYRLYREDVDDAEQDDENRLLPAMAENDKLGLKEVVPNQHFTEPPPRYTEASLVKKMEELGIGRPSTYSSIISVLQDRGYVKIDKRRFFPEDRGRIVTAFLENFFRTYVEYDFTANLEEALDSIARGETAWKKILREFWVSFHQTVQEASKQEMTAIITAVENAMAGHIFPTNPDGSQNRQCPSCNSGILGLRLGKFGAFLGCSAYPECRHTRPLVTVDEKNDANSGAGDEPSAKALTETSELGLDAEGNQITLRKGPYGWYVQRGVDAKQPGFKRTSLPRGKAPQNVTLAEALSLLALPRLVGMHPETGKEIRANIGRFGPYLQHDGGFTSIPKGDDLLEIGLNRAVVLIAEKAEKLAAKIAAGGEIKPSRFQKKAPAAKSKAPTKTKAKSAKSKTSAKAPKAKAASKTTVSKTSKKK